MENAGPSCDPFLSTNPTERYQRGLNTLKDTQRLVNESEVLGGGIMNQLHEQRGQIEDAIERNDEIDTNLQRSNRLIRRMFHRAFTIKVGLGCFAMILLLAICVIVYLKWISKAIPGHHGHSPSPPPLSNLSPPPAGRRLTESDPQIGNGLISLIAIGAAFLLACCAARPEKPARKFATFCGLGCLYSFIVLFLVLMPKKDYSQDGEAEEAADVAGLLRILFGCLMGLCALVGPVLVLVTHVIAAQKAPTVSDGSEELAPTPL